VKLSSSLFAFEMLSEMLSFLRIYLDYDFSILLLSLTIEFFLIYSSCSASVSSTGDWGALAGVVQSEPSLER
jgi:hypothetical protein